MNQFNKAMQTALGGAVGLIIAWTAEQFGGVQMPAEVVAALSTVLSILANLTMPANASA